MKKLLRKNFRALTTVKDNLSTTIEFAAIGFRNLSRHKTRTALTAGAITIGVVLIIVMVSLGVGVNRWLVDQLSTQLDLTSVMVLSKQAANRTGMYNFMAGPDKEKPDKSAEMPLLTQEVLASFYDIPGVEIVTPMTTITVDSAEFSGFDDTIIYSPTVVAMPLLDNDPYVREEVAGDYFSASKDRHKVVLTTFFVKRFLSAQESEEAEKEFSYDDLIGEKLVLTVPTKIAPTGIFSTTVESETMDVEIGAVINVGLDNTDIVINIDRSTEILANATGKTPEEFLDEVGYFSATVKVSSSSMTEEVADTIEAMGFVTTTTQDLISAVNDMLKVVQVSLSSFGIIALVVATLGIANTMVMAIYERTREIGIMKAIGASKATIRWMFLVESSLIGFLGGISGVAIGVALTPLGNALIGNYLSDAGISSGGRLFVLPVWLVFATIGVAILIATIAGLYPAQKASKLDPIKAIKYE